MSNKGKDVVFTYGNPACRLCSYSGYATICSFEELQQCPQLEFIKKLRAETKLRPGRAVPRVKNPRRRIVYGN